MAFYLGFCGAVGWSAVCDCGISCSYSLAFLHVLLLYHVMVYKIMQNYQFYTKMFLCSTDFSKGNKLCIIWTFCCFQYPHSTPIHNSKFKIKRNDRLLAGMCSYSLAFLHVLKLYHVMVYKIMQNYQFYTKMFLCSTDFSKGKKLCIIWTFCCFQYPHSTPIHNSKFKIKHNDWLLVDTCPQAANHCALFFSLRMRPDRYLR